MSKLQTTLSVFVLSALILLTGCADKGTLGQLSLVENDSDINSEKNESLTSDTEIELIPITEVRETFDKEAEKIKAQKFDNVSFENADFTFTEASEVCTLEYAKTQFTLSPDEAYDYMCKRTDELFPGMFSDEEKADMIRFSDCYTINDEKYPDCYPTLEQYKEMNLATEYPDTFIADENNYIWVHFGALCDYVHGDLEKREGYDSPELEMIWEVYGGIYANRFDAVSVYPSVYHTEDLKSEKTFRLESGDVSIAEAAAFIEKHLSELEISMRDFPFKMSLRSVYVLDTGDDRCAFYFTIVPEYKNIKYDCAKIDRSSYGISPISNSTNEAHVAGHVMMYEKDKISRLHVGVLPYYYDIVETGSHTSVMPLEKAAELASKYLAWNMRFKAQSASVVYKEISDKDVFEYPDTEAYLNRKVNVIPCWKFLLQPTTEPKKLFHVYVDMLTGDVYTFVQLMRQEEYD